MKVADIFDEAKKLHIAKGEEYGNTSAMFGNVLLALFPDGINIDCAADANKFGIYFMMIHKMMRIASTGFKSKDSVRDLCVYAAMLEELLEDNSD